MKTSLHRLENQSIAEVIADILIIKTPQDALDLLMSLSYEHQVTKVILHQENISPDFFDLKTG
jgi:hypothetical protein